MGNAIARIFEHIVSCGPKEVRILMLGLDGAGKTTILYKFKLGEYVRTVPTIGFNVETVRFKNLCFTVWDIGGQDKIRHLWRQYMVNAQGLIFVLDSCDRERLKKAKHELEKLMSYPELESVKLLVLANKHDIPTAVEVDEAAERLGLTNLKQSPEMQWKNWNWSSRWPGLALISHQGLIFVLDSCDKERIKKAKQELDKLMSDPELANVRLLVLANKHDLSDAIPVNEATEMVGLNILKHRKWHIQKCSGKTGEGLRDGLDWLANAIKGLISMRLPRSFSYSSHRSYSGAESN